MRPRPLKRLYDRREASYEKLRSEYLRRQSEGLPTRPLGIGRSEPSAIRRASWPGENPRPTNVPTPPRASSPSILSRIRPHSRGSTSPEARGTRRLRHRDRLRTRGRRDQPRGRRPDLRRQGTAAFNPLIVHATRPPMARHVRPATGPTRPAPSPQAFWPGPLTLVLPRSASSPTSSRPGRDTVGVRVPAPAVARLLDRTGRRVPIAAPAPIVPPGSPPPSPATSWTTSEGRIDLILDSGQTTLGASNRPSST